MIFKEILEQELEDGRIPFSELKKIKQFMDAGNFEDAWDLYNGKFNSSTYAPKTIKNQWSKEDHIKMTKAVGHKNTSGPRQKKDVNSNDFIKSSIRVYNELLSIRKTDLSIMRVKSPYMKRQIVVMRKYFKHYDVVSSELRKRQAEKTLMKISAESQEQRVHTKKDLNPGISNISGPVITFIKSDIKRIEKKIAEAVSITETVDISDAVFKELPFMMKQGSNESFKDFEKKLLKKATVLKIRLPKEKDAINKLVNLGLFSKKAFMEHKAEKDKYMSLNKVSNKEETKAKKPRINNALSSMGDSIKTGAKIIESIKTSINSFGEKPTSADGDLFEKLKNDLVVLAKIIKDESFYDKSGNPLTAPKIKELSKKAEKTKHDEMIIKGYDLKVRQGDLVSELSKLYKAAKTIRIDKGQPFKTGPLVKKLNELKKSFGEGLPINKIQKVDQKRLDDIIGRK